MELFAAANAVSNNGANIALGTIIWTMVPLIISMLIAHFVMSIFLWKIFKKAGRKSWAALIPFYDSVVLLKIAGFPAWYIILFFVPIIRIYEVFNVNIKLAKKFGQSTIFGIAMAFFPYICRPILAFNKNIVYVDNNQNNLNAGQARNNNQQPIMSGHNQQPMQNISQQPTSNYDNQQLLQQQPISNASQPILQQLPLQQPAPQQLSQQPTPQQPTPQQPTDNSNPQTPINPNPFV